MRKLTAGASVSKENIWKISVDRNSFIGARQENTVSCCMMYKQTVMYAHYHSDADAHAPNRHTPRCAAVQVNDPEREGEQTGPHKISLLYHTSVSSQTHQTLLSAKTCGKTSP